MNLSAHPRAAVLEDHNGDGLVEPSVPPPTPMEQLLGKFVNRFWLGPVKAHHQEGVVDHLQRLLIQRIPLQEEISLAPLIAVLRGQEADWGLQILRPNLDLQQPLKLPVDAHHHHHQFL